MKWDKDLISQLSTPKFKFFRVSEWTKEGTPWKWILTIFKYKKWISITVRAQKLDEKKGSFVWVMVLKLPKIVHFLQICADFNKKSKSIKTIYLHLSKIPYHALSENNIFYRGLNNSSWDIEILRFNPNWGGLFRGSFCGGGITFPTRPPPSLSKTWSLVQKYTHIFSFRKFTRPP